MTTPASTDTRFYAQNRFPGSCAACSKAVPPREGTAFQKAGQRWSTVHKTPNCLGKVLTAEELSDLEAVMAEDNKPQRRELTAEGQVFHPFPDAAKYPGAKELISSFPVTGDRDRPAWDKPRGCRWVSLELGDRARVLELADKLGLTVAPELRDFESEISDDVKACLARAANAGAYDYQMEGIRALALNDRWLLGDDMGLGKTMQALLAIPDGSGALIVCPKSLKRNWAEEAARWRPDLAVFVCSKTAGKDFRWPKANEIIVTHYEALPAYLGMPAEESAPHVAKVARLTDEERELLTGGETGRRPKDFHKTPACASLVAKGLMERTDKSAKVSRKGIKWASAHTWATYWAPQLGDFEHVLVAVDEAHRAKNANAIRSKKIQALAERCAKIWLLTGTPLLNKPFDLLGVLRAGGMDAKTFGGFRGFTKLFRAHKNRWGGWEFGAPDPSVPERLRRCMLRRLKAEVLPELPPKQRQILLVDDMAGKVRKLLDEEWKNYVAEKLGKTVKELTDLDLERVSDDELPHFSTFSSIRALLAESRIEAMDSFVQDCEEQEKPLLVFSAHRAPIDHLNEREGWATITGDTPSDDRAEIVKRFQAGELKGLGLTITAGGVGLTLTHASVVLFVDLDWTPANNLQAEDRVARIGQLADSIQIVQMVTDHPLDRHVHKLILEKMAMSDAAVEREVEYTAPVDAPVAQVDFDAARDVAANMDRTERLEAVDTRATILDGHAGGGGGGTAPSWREVVLTPEQREALPSAWSLLLAMCDGAREKDGAGFSKADVGLAHIAMPVLDDDLALQVAFETLRKYHGQLAHMYPCLYPSLAEVAS